MAIDIGYRHIDSAHLYRNEVQVGNAVRAKIADGTVKREDIFVTTKVFAWVTLRWIQSLNFNEIFVHLLDTLKLICIVFFFPQLWNIFHEPEWVEKSFNRSFENLNLDYIDMYLLHFPIAWQRVLKNESLPVDDVDSYELFPKDSDGMLMKPNI